MKLATSPLLQTRVHQHFSPSDLSTGANASKQLKLETVHRYPAPRKESLRERRTLDRRRIVPTTREIHSHRKIQNAPNTLKTAATTQRVKDTYTQEQTQPQKNEEKNKTKQKH